MWLGLKKQKKIRHVVRFEGMITPLSRGSSFSEDFDSFEEEKISDWQTELDDPFFSDSGKGLKNYSALLTPEGPKISFPRIDPNAVGIRNFKFLKQASLIIRIWNQEHK